VAGADDAGHLECRGASRKRRRRRSLDEIRFVHEWADGKDRSTNVQHIRRHRPSLALVIACIALFVVVGGGTALAARLITGRDVKNGSLHGVDVHRNTLTGRQIRESRLGIVPHAGDAKKLGGVGAGGYGLAGVPLVAQGANGVGNNAGCASGDLGIVVRDGRGDPIDARFSFQVPGSPEAFGQIRSDGSIRSSSANVASVTHTADSGIYCIHFGVALTADALEAAVAAPHEN
jgi:hypothetical protein